MNVHDEEFLDSIAVLALGALPETEARELAAHVAGCATCRTVYNEFRETSDLIGYSAESGAGELSELAARRMKSAVMRAVRETPRAVDPTLPESRGASNVSRRAFSWIGYAAAAAAIVFALSSNANDATLRAEHESDLQRIAALEARTTAQSSEAATSATRVAAILAPSSKHFAVNSGDVITSGGHVYFALRLAAPPAGKVYQAWTLARGAKAVAASITFVPGASAVTVIELPERAADLAAVALSVEPEGGSKAPTSKPAFVRPLS